MRSIFNRYPPPSRRAIFYALETALHAGAQEVDSVHLLSGVLFESTTRANTLFSLEERLPAEVKTARAVTMVPNPKTLPLARDSRRVLAFAAEEANRLDDYWIDTDYLILGTLREKSSPAAAKLGAAGLRIDKARDLVASSKEVREAYGPVPALWQLSKPIARVGRVAGIMYLLLLAILIKFLLGRSC